MYKATESFFCVYPLSWGQKWTVTENRFDKSASNIVFEY